MDPLSASASVIAIVGATGKVIKGIRSLKALRDAPRKLDDLLDEVSQLETILQAVRNVSEDAGSDLKRLIETAQKILIELDSLIEYKLTEVGTSNKVDRWQWIRSSKDVERLRGKLQNVTSNLVALIGVNTSSTIYQVSQVANQALSEQRQFTSQCLQAMTLLSHLLEESPSTRAALTGSPRNIRQLTQGPAVPENNTLSKFASSEIQQTDQKATRPQFEGLFCVSKTQIISICSAYYECKCHVMGSIDAPGILSTLFGCGYVRKAGSLIFGNQCDTETCRANAALSVSIRYCLPPWLASRMVLTWITSSPLYGLELLLQFPRVLDRHSAAFAAVWADDSKELEIALRRGECRPYDVDKHGLNLFEFALVSKRWEALHYLSNDDDRWILSAGQFCVWTMWQILQVFVDEKVATFHLDQQRSIASKLESLNESDSYRWINATRRMRGPVTRIDEASLDTELGGSITIEKKATVGRSGQWCVVVHHGIDEPSEMRYFTRLEEVSLRKTSQGDPKADQYPPYGENGRQDPASQPVPGAWPVS